VDEIRVFIAPKLLGAGLSPLHHASTQMNAATQLLHPHVEWVGPDILVTGLLSPKRG
jgi:diaminohydroxyphosphoribosylaminopyrimidine deaminase / 5-amino-6-(5-phosphoribosylamino)uracil reductase